MWFFCILFLKEFFFIANWLRGYDDREVMRT